MKQFVNKFENIVIFPDEALVTLFKEALLSSSAHRDDAILLASSYILIMSTSLAESLFKASNDKATNT